MELPELRKTLLQLQAADQKFRIKIQSEIAKMGFYSKETVLKINAIDKKNREQLKKIIVKHGWPTISMVGEDGAHAAWLVAQHSDLDLEFQKEILTVFEKLLPIGEVSKSNYAYLKDRVLVNEGKPQLFGTQFTDDSDKHPIPQPIKDRKNLDKRRAAFELIPFEEYEKFFHLSP